MSDQIRASHILIGHSEVSGSTSNLTKEDALAQINQLKIDIEAGAEFAQVAQEHSDCPSSSNGGDLGEFGPGQMVKEFDDVVFTGELNTVHGPVKTQFGYHLLEITERTD